MRRLTSSALLLSAMLFALPGLALDGDGDGIDDAVDNCVDVANPIQCDTDQDGFGNGCDADYDQDGSVNSPEIQTFLDDFATGIDSGVGTDSDCSGQVNAADWQAVVDQFTILGHPGPSGLLCAGSVPCLDADHDGVADHLDNCTGLANAEQCDADQDGYGNGCDGDFDQSTVVNGIDFSSFFLPDFQTGIDSGVGTDMNCDGTVNANDYSVYFLPQFTSGLPGPSGLACAGTAPCLGADPNVSVEIVFNDLLTNPGVRSATDSQGRLHAIYIADAVGDPSTVLRYVTQVAPGGPLTLETIVQTPIGEHLSGLMDIAIDSNDEPCVVWSKSPDGVNALEAFYGCRDTGSFTFEDVSQWVRRSSAGLHLELNSQDYAHIALYQHLPLDLSPNHRVRHIWFDGTDWQKENVPLPPSYQPPAIADALSSAVCAAIDASDRVHFAYGVADDYLLRNPPVADYQGALAYIVWDPSSSWGAGSVIRADVAGGLTPKELMRGCDLAIDAAGDLQLVYHANFEGGVPESQAFYGTDASGTWSFTDLGAGSSIGTVETDTAGDVFFVKSGGLPAVDFDLRRIDGAGTVGGSTFGAYFTRLVAGSIRNPSPSETTCQLLSSNRLRQSEHRILLTTVENCQLQ